MFFLYYCYQNLLLWIDLINHLFKASWGLQLYFNRSQQFNANSCKSNDGILNLRKLMGKEICVCVCVGGSFWKEVR